MERDLNALTSHLVLRCQLEQMTIWVAFRSKARPVCRLHAARSSQQLEVLCGALTYRAGH